MDQDHDPSSSCMYSWKLKAIMHIPHQETEMWKGTWLLGHIPHVQFLRQNVNWQLLIHKQCPLHSPPTRFQASYAGVLPKAKTYTPILKGKTPTHTPKGLKSEGDTISKINAATSPLHFYVGTCFLESDIFGNAVSNRIFLASSCFLEINMALWIPADRKGIFDGRPILAYLWKSSFPLLI